MLHMIESANSQSHEVDPGPAQCQAPIIHHPALSTHSGFSRLPLRNLVLEALLTSAAQLPCFFGTSEPHHPSPYALTRCELDGSRAS